MGLTLQKVWLRVGRYELFSQFCPYSLSYIVLLTFDNSKIFPGSESMMSLEKIFDEKVLRKVKSIKKILNAEQSIFGKWVIMAV